MSNPIEDIYRALTAYSDHAQDGSIGLWSAGSEKRAEWDKLVERAVELGVCPNCATVVEPMLSTLGPWKPGSVEEYAGKECPNCEEFFPCGDQAEDQQDYTPDTHSDADPGL